MGIYVDSNDKGIPDDVKDEAKKVFHGYNIEYKDLQQPWRGIVTELPSSKKQKKEELLDLSRKIGENLHVFEKRINVTAVCASYKVTDLKEKDIPCVTVFVLGKGKIPAGETDFNEIRDNYGILFGNAEFDVVEGYFKLANSDKPLNASYARALRGGVGIGVVGSTSAGTLGGFLKDEDKKRYIFSNEHVLNPRKEKDGTNEAVHVAGTSEQSLEGVEEIGCSRSNQHSNDVDVENITSPEIIIQQPAQLDYDAIKEVAKNDVDYCKKEQTKFKNKLATRQQGMSKTELVNLKKDNKSKLHNARKIKKKIKKKTPRNVGRRVCGLHKNVPSDDQNCNFFVDAAIAEVYEKELGYIKTSKSMEDPENRCPLYGFVNKGDFKPKGEIVHLETFRREEPEFVKFGRTTGFTDKGFVDDSMPILYVNLAFGQPPCNSKYGSQVQNLYCEDCIKLYTDEGTSSNELSKENVNCIRCGKLLKAEDNNDNNGVWPYWAHNCFVIRKNKEPFTKPGDSGAILFDNKGRAWGLVFGEFTQPLKNTVYCLASPLCVALKALEQEFDMKGLKLW